MSTLSPDNPPSPQLPVNAHRIFLCTVAVVFVVMAIVMVFFPRTRYSELEKRDLATFPDPADYSGHPARLTAAVSQWFSDSEPYRDTFMGLSMSIRDFFRVSFPGDEQAVTFRPAAPPAEESASPADGIPEPAAAMADVALPEEGSAKIANAGIIIVGTGPDVRALMAFGGSPGGGKAYIDALNTYAETFPDARVYALVSPTATAFYLPAKAAKASKSQGPVIQYIHEHLNPAVKIVDAYSALAAHTDEDIYLRTDHHWAPLGGFYAAQAFAQKAGVPFPGLDRYERHVVHGFVGSMFGYSKDISVKKAPEDFVYYTPTGVDYTTTYVTYSVNKSYQVTSASKPYQGRFFHSFRDGSGAAYCTFMGGDQHLVKVETSTPGNRRVLIIKDSFGNTLPGYLFYSFNQVHVVDFRYFNQNMKDYVKQNGITDIVIAFNIFNAYGAAAPRKAKNFLTQHGGTFAAPDPEPPATPTDSAAADTATPAPPDTVAAPPAPAPADTTSTSI